VLIVIAEPPPPVATASPPPELGHLSHEQLAKVREHFETFPGPTRAARSYRRLLARYYQLLVPPDASVLEIGCGDGELLAQLSARRKTGIDLSGAQLARARARVPEGRFFEQAGELLELGETFDVIIISETLNFAADVQQLLDRAATVATARTRLILNFHNNVWRPIFSIAEWIGLRARQPATSWLSTQDIENLLELSQWEVIKRQPRLLWPMQAAVVGPLLNRWIAPFLAPLGFAIFIVARPKPMPEPKPLSVSVVIPARNEAGNIEAAVRRTPEMGAGTELIFIEGHSADNTWEEILRVQKAYPGRPIKAMRQTGRGKGNAVREAFAAASGDLLMILDADLTMPPEELPKFYEAIASGRAEFANGSRLVYPMDKHAMQFANMVANKLFGLTFSWLLGQRIKDTLCGTKVLRRSHYDRIAAQRAYFGEFDPFGDFDLLFGADKLNLKIRDVPIRYRERTYGETNISRFKHGIILLRMCLFASRKCKFI